MLDAKGDMVRKGQIWGCLKSIFVSVCDCAHQADIICNWILFLFWLG